MNPAAFNIWLHICIELVQMQAEITARRLAEVGKGKHQ